MSKESGFLYVPELFDLCSRIVEGVCLRITRNFTADVGNLHTIFK